ncbi:hypothetical protein N8T08_006344 [Aspergillus melleus]|uniref:Uncharacterized protein n=1 Tax=Aspergillus melleus TaxID=138277 RepID=A0ACC3B0A3_9EURO|nr:hypothetical protein N8T08_006344 [Aspergillus melleus]
MRLDQSGKVLRSTPEVHQRAASGRRRTHTSPEIRFFFESSVHLPSSDSSSNARTVARWDGQETIPSRTLLNLVEGSSLADYAR